ncbi:cell wall lytic activity [Bacillus sp. JCM 19045]|nr:cell wall lytic activity [Bacillus sp. JCM 19045]
MSKSTINKVLFSSAVVAGIVAVAPQESEAALGDQTLRQGMSHPDVTELQTTLKEKGFFTYHTATGFYGTHTRDAVLAYQKANNLQVDGTAGPQTLGSLVKSGAVLSPSNSNASNNNSSSSSSTVAMRIGNRGNNVTGLQDQLRTLGFFNQSSTGYYGTVTREAVRNYQRANNLQVDGIAGPQTQAHLRSGNSSSAPSNNTSNNNNNNNSNAGSNTTPPASTPSSSAMRLGQRGSNVTELQQQLRTLGYFNQNPTGYYGEVTRNAVREFQRTNGLSVDGVAGPATQSKLKNNPSPVNKNQSTTNNGNSSNNNSNSNPAPSQSASGLVSGLVSSANSVIGTPYLWGGTSPAGFDCSGMIQYIFRQNGVSIPRTVSEQWNSGTSVSSPSVGDIVFFETYKSGPSHNGIYIGNNKFIHTAHRVEWKFPT